MPIGFHETVFFGGSFVFCAQITRCGQEQYFVTAGVDNPAFVGVYFADKAEMMSVGHPHWGCRVGVWGGGGGTILSDCDPTEPYQKNIFKHLKAPCVCGFTFIKYQYN